MSDTIGRLVVAAERYAVAVAENFSGEAEVAAELNALVAEARTNQIPGRCSQCRWEYGDGDLRYCYHGTGRRVTPDDFCDRWEARDELPHSSTSVSVGPFRVGDGGKR